MLPAFLLNIKLEQFQIKVLKQSHYFSETVIFFFETTFSLLFYRCTFKSALNGFYKLDYMTHSVYFFAEYKTGAIANHCFEVLP